MSEEKMYSMQTGDTSNCGEAAISEEYQSFLIDYYADGQFFQEEYPSYCFRPIGYSQGVIYIRSDQPLTGAAKDIRYNMIPKCYGLLASEELEETGVLRVRRSPQLGYRGQGTLTAIIDTGINMTDPLFLYENGQTKIASLWDQTGTQGQSPAGFFFGTEWTKEQINQVILDGETESFPKDEDGHGTFLAAIAAGRETEGGFSGVVPDSELVVVKLKQAKLYLRDFYSIDKAVWACQEDDVMLAVRYVVAVASALGKPVSICLGIGTNLGGHGGSNGLARYIAFLSLLPGISFHIASGNEGISGHHFQGRIQGGAAFETVEFNVGTGENGFVMELWGRDPAVFSVGVLSPGGETVDRIQLKINEFRSIRFFPEETVLQIRAYPGETISGDHVIRLNFRNPSEGIWRLFVYGTENGSTNRMREYDLWMPITNFLKEDTFFLNADVGETITSPGNTLYGMTYVPYDVTTDSLYVRASRGYSRDGRVKPDLAAPGVAVAVPGPDGRQRVRSGSSVAAAFGVGMGAILQEWAIVKENDPSMNGQNMRSYLIQGAVRIGAYEYPNEEWGYGIVNIYDTFLALRR